MSSSGGAENVTPDVLAALDARYSATTQAPGQSILLHRKVRGANIVPKPFGSYGWPGLFSEWDWANWIKPQIDRAVALNRNAIRIILPADVTLVAPYGGGQGLSQITLPTYLTRLSQLASYCQSVGLYLYPCLVEKWDFSDSQGTTAPNYQATDVTNVVVQSAALLSSFRNVIGFDLFQEGDANFAPGWAASTTYAVGTIVTANSESYKATTAGTSASSGAGPSGTGSSITDGTVTWQYVGVALQVADVLAMMSAVRTVSTLPLTCSNSSGGFGNAAGFWADQSSLPYQVATAPGGSDFIDLHVYLDNVQPGDMDPFLAIGKPIVIGEFGANQALTPAAQTARFQGIAGLHNRERIIGSFVWGLANQDSTGGTSNDYGVWDNTGFAQTSLANPSTSPLSTTTGKRTALTGVLPQFVVADPPSRYVVPEMLTSVQARPRNVAVASTAGFQLSANTYVFSDPRGLAFSATAAGNTVASTRALVGKSPAVTAGNYYRAKVSMLATVTARTVTLAVDWYDSTGTYINTSSGVTLTDDTVAVATAELLVRATTAGNGASIGVVKVTVSGCAVNETHLLLEASFKPAT